MRVGPLDNPEPNAAVLQAVDGELRRATPAHRDRRGINNVVTIADAPAINTWHRMTFVFDDGELTYYLRSNPVTTVDYPPAQTSAKQLYFGGAPGAQTVDGVIDDSPYTLVS